MFSGTVLMTNRGQKLSGSGSGGGWKAHLEHIQAHPYSGQGSCSQFLTAMFSWVLKISMDGDYKTSLGNLLQCFITFTMESFFLFSDEISCHLSLSCHKIPMRRVWIHHLLIVRINQAIVF